MSLVNMTDTIASKVKMAVDERLERIEEMFATSVDAQKRQLEDHISPYHQTMQLLMENAVSEAMKTTTVTLNPKTEHQILRLNDRLKNVEAKLALALSIDASTPSRLTN